MPKFTIILPTYNRLEQLKLVLIGLENQIYPLENFEVIVISDGSTDGTYEYLQTLQTPLNLKPIEQQNGGAASARNTGISHAKSEMILFIDDDVVPAPELVYEHAQIHEDIEADIVVIGPMLTPLDYDMQPWVIWEQEMLYKQYHEMQAGKYQPTARQFYTGNTSLTRECLEVSGGFDTRFRRAEDVELAYRLADQGMKFVFAPNAIGYHYAKRSFKSWFAIPYDYGRNDVIFACEKKQDWILSTIFREFSSRNFFIKLLIRLILDRDHLSKITVEFFRVMARIGRSIHVGFLSRVAYSVLFNYQYYQGVSDKLGGRSCFFAEVNQQTQEAKKN